MDESLVVNQPVGTKESRDVYRITKSGRTWDLSKVEQMLQQNVTRTDFAQRLQAIIDAIYNAGSSSADNYFDELVKSAKELRAESERHVREWLTEDELEIFDLLKKDSMTQVEEVLHIHLPESYDRVLFKDKCNHIFEVMVD